MKTIAELNAKWWYRLVKVIFIGFALLFMIISVFVIQDDNRPRQTKDYKIDCVAEYTNKKSFLAEKDANIYDIYSYGTATVYSSPSADSKRKIREICDISDEEANTGNQTAITYIKEKELLGVDKATIQKYIDDNLRPYTISETYITKGSYFAIVAYSILSMIGIIIVAEIIRRVFYYIVLGSIKPKKM